ncbi:MAG: hypothetical protein SFZ23_09345 [Planctomycetota bacterium]|nr:hypothetical protein [Planctomycetota bacterium]
MNPDMIPDTSHRRGADDISASLPRRGAQVVISTTPSPALIERRTQIRRGALRAMSRRRTARRVARGGGALVALASLGLAAIVARDPGRSEPPAIQPDRLVHVTNPQPNLPTANPPHARNHHGVEGPASDRPPETRPGVVEPATLVRVQIVRDDPGIVRRLSVDAGESTVAKLTDDGLLRQLRELDHHVGLVRVGDRVHIVEHAARSRPRPTGRGGPCADSNAAFHAGLQAGCDGEAVIQG